MFGKGISGGLVTTVTSSESLMVTVTSVSLGSSENSGLLVDLHNVSRCHLLPELCMTLD